MERQSKALDKSVRSGQNNFPLSTAGFHFSNIFKRQYSVLYPFLKPQRRLNERLSI